MEAEEVVTDQVAEVIEAAMEAVIGAAMEAGMEDTEEEEIVVGDGGHLIGGPSSGMTMNKTET